MSRFQEGLRRLKQKFFWSSEAVWYCLRISGPHAIFVQGSLVRDRAPPKFQPNPKQRAKGHLRHTRASTVSRCRIGDLAEQKDAQFIFPYDMAGDISEHLETMDDVKLVPEQERRRKVRRYAKKPQFFERSTTQTIECRLDFRNQLGCHVIWGS